MGIFAQLQIAASPEEDYINYNAHRTSYTVAFILSGLGICYIMFTLIYLKLYQNTLGRMIFFISFCDLLLNACMVPLYLIDGSDLSELKCKIFVGIGHYAALTSFAWATCFTHAFYKVIKERWDNSIAANMKYYIVISFGVPIPLGILAIMWEFVEFGDEEMPYCYHRLVYGALDKSFFYTENLPFAIAVLLSFYYCIASIKIMRSIAGEFGSRWQVLWILQFPFILIICWLGQQINAICAQLDYHLEYGKELSAFFQTLIYMQGFINAIAYGVSYRVVSGYKDLCKKCCKRKKSSNPIDESHVSDIVNSGGASDRIQLEEDLLERAMRMKSSGVKNAGGLTEATTHETFPQY